MRPIEAIGSGSTLQFRAQELPFQYERGDTGLCWPVEPVGGGVALLDFDADDDLDLFFPQGKPLAETNPTPQFHDVLLRNDDGQFVDVSESVGLVAKGYGMGATVADYDADGDPDIYVTRYGPNTLWQNAGGKFVDVTADLGVECPLWSLGAAFADFDGDNDLDLFVANYLAFDPREAPYLRNPETGAAEYAMPADFKGLPAALFRNDQSRFVDVSAPAGIDLPMWSMGVLAADFDADARVDILVAVDAHPNALWRNLGGLRFENAAFPLGLAVNAHGQAEANMGIAFGDIDRNGLEDVLITHFLDEHDTLWQAFEAKPSGRLYRDTTLETGLGSVSRDSTGWGTAFADFDRDGDLDLIVVNGHIRHWPKASLKYDNPARVFANDGRGRFEDVSPAAGSYFQDLHQGRGLAVGDLDNDGDQDVVIVHHHKPSVVLWNETPPKGGFVSVRLIGAGNNRDAVGAQVRLITASGTQVRTVTGGGSYLSASETRIHFGLGDATTVDRIEIRWPGGKHDAIAKVATDQTLVIKE